MDPDPSALLVNLDPTTSIGSPWLVLLSWLVVVLAGTFRAVLQHSSRTRLCEEEKSAERRDFYEQALDREDEIDISLGFIQVTALIGFVLALTFSLPIEGRTEWFGLSVAPNRAWLWILALSTLFLLPSIDAVPNGLARRGKAEKLLGPSLRVLYAWSWVCRPISKLVLRTRGGATRLFQTDSEVPEERERELLTDEILDAVEESERAGAIEESEAHMIEGVLELPELHASEVMTPRTDMTSIPIEASIEEATRQAHEAGHSKVPVYKGNRDEICGIFHLRDAIPILLNGSDHLPPLEEILRPVFFVPATKRVVQLLREFQENESSLAIVLDEYGGTEGLITVEDILEEIVGDLREPHDQEESQHIQRLEQGVISIDPRLRIEEINEELDLRLPESEDYDTVGGFVVCQLDRIPKCNEVFVYEDLEFKVLQVENRRISRLQLRPLNRAG